MAVGGRGVRRATGVRGPADVAELERRVRAAAAGQPVVGPADVPPERQPLYQRPVLRPEFRMPRDRPSIGGRLSTLSNMHQPQHHPTQTLLDVTAAPGLPLKSTAVNGSKPVPEMLTVEPAMPDAGVKAVIKLKMNDMNLRITNSPALRWQPAPHLNLE